MQYARIAPMLQHLACPLSAVSAAWQGEAAAHLAFAVSNASRLRERPRAMVYLSKDSHTYELARQSKALCVNFLGPDQMDLLHRFAFAPGSDLESLAGVPHRLSVRTGCPVLADVYGYMDCRVANVMDGGDMAFFLAEVVDGDVLRPEAGPMWWDETKPRLPVEWWQQFRARKERSQAWARKHVNKVKVDETAW